MTGIPEGRQAPGARAAAMQAERRRICLHLPAEIFGDPALDIFLETFVAAEKREPCTVESCTAAANLPPATAARWIARLERDGLLHLEGDIHDRQAGVRLTPEAERRFARWLSGHAT